MTFPAAVLPQFYCPFPKRLNRHAEAAQQHTLAWVRRFGLVSEAAFLRLKASRFGYLAARAYPDAGEEELKLVCDWNTWLFIRDDQCDETGVGKDPQKLAALHRRWLGLLMERTCPGKDDALGLALLDLWQRLRARSSLAWQARFIASVAEYFESSVWEAQNRALGTCPDLASYVKMRPFTGGLYTDLELIEVVEHILLPLEIRCHPVLQRLARLTNDVVCWSNDVFSLSKESAQGDVHNLVVVLARQHSLEIQEAVEWAAQMCNAQVKRFLALEKRLPDFPSPYAEAVAKYLDVLRAWMRGNLDWSLESARYHPVFLNESSYGEVCLAN